jgi:hypothetical protein
MTVDIREQTLRAAELLLHAAHPVIGGSAIAVGHRAASRVLLRMIVREVAVRRGLRNPDAALRSIDAGVREAWSAELRACVDALDEPTWLDEATRAELLASLAELVAQVDRSLDTLGLIHEHLLDPFARKRSGTFYTPPALARATVDKTLGPLLREPDAILELRICEPAMGGGAFLLAALDSLAQASSASRRELAQRCLYGVDLDPLAVELARLALWLAVGDREAPCDFMAANLRCGDALIGLRDASDRETADRECARVFDDQRAPGELAERWAFFHWSLAFPHVFARPRGGFDAMLGNPPWEIRKPSSREFFGERDPEYRERTNQAAIDHQQALLDADPELREAWTRERDRHRAFSRWIRHAFHHQGMADRNSYKLFVERAHLLLREGGRLGMIVPSSLYADKGAAELRSLLLDHGRWEWLFSFENSEGIFEIHRSFKFAVIVVGKAGRTDAVQVAFMRHDIAQWAMAEPPALAYPRERIEQFSPGARAIVELDDRRDLELLERIHRHGVLLGDSSEQGWSIRYRREFDMTNDAHRFAPRARWEADGYRPDEYGHWLAGDWRPIAAFGFDGNRHARDPGGRWSMLERPEDLVISRDGTQGLELAAIRGLALPVYEGRMIDQYDFSAKGWVAGSGRSATWREIDFVDKQVEPQFLMAGHEHAARRGAADRLTLGIMDVTAATNSRSLIAALTHDRPHGNKVPRLMLADERDAIELLASLDSLTVDFALRQRLAGLTLNAFILAEVPVAARGRLSESLRDELLGLALPHVAFAPIWLRHRNSSMGWRRSWALTRAERMRRRVLLDVAIAVALGLDEADMAWMLRDCDRPSERRGAASNPKGFWRVDKHAPPHERHTVLVQAAHRELCRRGLAEFLAMNEGQGWLPPAEMGPRLHPWQQAEDASASWEECERHVRSIDAILASAR